MSEMMTLEQQRAMFALDKIRNLSESILKDYAGPVKSFPAVILMDGLGQGVATLMAKKDDKGRKELLDHLQTWLCQDNRLSPYYRKASLIEAIIKGSQDDYVQAQAETLALLVWLKKFAQARQPADKKE